METSLRAAILDTLQNHSTFVLANMQVPLTPEQIYDGLIGEPHVIQAFREAVKYMPMNACSKRLNIALNGAPLTVNVRLPSTTTYPMYLWPSYLLNVHPQSDLGQFLQTPMRVAMEWEMLTTTFIRITQDVGDVLAVALLMPWIREIIQQWVDEHPILQSFGSLNRARQTINREAQRILSERPPANFPRMTKELNAVCLSGGRLIAQARMLEGSLNEQQLANIPSIQLDRGNFTPPTWMREHLDEAMEDWKEECAAITAQDGSDILKRRRHR